jgi:uncharacterized membrane protein
MSSRKRKPVTLSRGEKLRLGALSAFTLAVIVSVMWFHLALSKEQIRADIEMQAGSELHVPVATLSGGDAYTYAVKAPDDTMFRIFVSGNRLRGYNVAHAACRRCRGRGGKTYVKNQQLFCNHCRQPMPTVARSADLPTETDCTAVPIAYSISGDDIVVSRGDLESTAHLLRN